MTNLANSDFLPFWYLILKIWHTLERPVVQIQLLGIAVILFLAWLAAQGIWFQWRKQISANNKLTFRCYEFFCRKFSAASPALYSCANSGVDWDYFAQECFPLSGVEWRINEPNEPHILK